MRTGSTEGPRTPGHEQSGSVGSVTDDIGSWPVLAGSRGIHKEEVSLIE